MTKNQSTDAKKLIQQASQGGAVDQYNFALRYATGEGVPQDDVQAHMWFNLAAVQGHTNGATNRDLVAGKMSPQQIERTQLLARNWKPKKK